MEVAAGLAAKTSMVTASRTKIDSSKPLRGLTEANGADSAGEIQHLPDSKQDTRYTLSRSERIFHRRMLASHSRPLRRAFSQTILWWIY